MYITFGFIYTFFLQYRFQLVEEKGTPTKFLDASNRFYTLIPHNFGMKKPPLLDTAEIVKVIIVRVLYIISICFVIGFHSSFLFRPRLKCLITFWKLKSPTVF